MFLVVCLQLAVDGLQEVGLAKGCGQLERLLLRLYRLWTLMDGGESECWLPYLSHERDTLPDETHSFWSLIQKFLALEANHGYSIVLSYQRA